MSATSVSAAADTGLRTVRIGTRRSLLARTQSQWVADLVTARTGHPAELVEITTDGDRSQAAGTSLVGSASTGVFVSALREALLAGQVDLAVHSLKDLPTAPEPGITLVAVPGREDPRDVVVARDGLTLGELPVGSRIGTGSPRRAAQLHALGLGLEVVAIRGNVDTRIGTVTRGDLDAVVLARAGLARIERLHEATEVLDPLQMLPAPGQGALALECRDDDTELRHLLAPLDEPDVRAAVTAERAVLATLEGGCSAPIGALADVVEADDLDDPEGSPELWLRAIALSADGTLSVRMSATGSVADAVGVGTRLGGEMLAEGAGQLDQPGPASTSDTDEVPHA
ncbi:hydroxymethylbilane synthase [Nocardioides sp. CBS4Y-1]|uniref:Porphobilinogen deaminase n=1 Tax=Nocardioides acrostichi TaxID=2784339 RepID=A0A930Y989_9ACTN|nr:hydroxymethylbilane synthase [Nocardioides acrostichi]MBF4163866.1 hydroxymethylbilane synthase [Nocardioides acrostichi]